MIQRNEDKHVSNSHFGIQPENSPPKAGCFQASKPRVRARRYWELLISTSCTLPNWRVWAALWGEP